MLAGATGLTINGTAIGVSLCINCRSRYAIAINLKTDTTGVTATAYNLSKRHCTRNGG